ncbi:hypothetical protein C4571_03030 [Candidatus Parcubacteria bacterium]|nr:MAG: hypothetical protein C4571_03030 [Candidatus Parcubacteria bacterium]
MKKTLFCFLVIVFFFLSVSSARAVAYPFGGRITAIVPPLPFGPCPLPAIVVGLPKPGTFMIPPGVLFPFFNLTIGKFVLGLAATPFCGPIYFVGTSL